jgi:hypothetical protein
VCRCCLGPHPCIARNPLHPPVWTLLWRRSSFSWSRTTSKRCVAPCVNRQKQSRLCWRMLVL